MLALIRAGGLPPPEVNVRVGRHELDFFWRDAALDLELDGWGGHSDRFERDRLRDAELKAARIRVMRVSWRQLEGSREAVLARLAQALALSPGFAPTRVAARTA